MNLNNKMTKKDYELLGNVFAEYYIDAKEMRMDADELYQEIINSLCIEFQKENKGFNAEKFWEYIVKNDLK